MWPRVLETQSAEPASTEKRLRDQINKPGRTIHCEVRRKLVMVQRTRDSGGVMALTKL